MLVIFKVITHGFDPNHPPGNVHLYREGVRLYEQAHYASAELVFRDALEQAKKEQCSDSTIRLYEVQMKKSQDAHHQTKGRWWKKMFPIVGGSSSVSLATGYYFGLNRTKELAL